MNERSFIAVSIRMQDKRDSILRAAEALIATQGLHNLSMKKLATAANVAAGTIYRYFTDKDELISELRRDVLINVADFIFTDFEKGTIEEQFVLLWFNFLKLNSSQSPILLNYQQYNQLPGIDTDDHRVFEEQTFKPLLEMFKKGKRQGLITNLNDEYLFSIGFEPAVALGGRILNGHLQYIESELLIACNRCWLAISTNLESKLK